MRIKERYDILYLQFSNIEALPFVRHAVFTRQGGVSVSPFDSLNISYSVGDAWDAVSRNREKIGMVMKNADLVFMRQVHGIDVLSFTEDSFHRKENGGAGYQTGDALVSSAGGKTLVVKTADCQPVLMVDPVLRVVACVHSGWRGSIRNIVGQVVLVMTERFGSNPADILAGVGPSLGPCCAEFIHYRTEIPPSLWRYRQREVYFDFWSMTRDQLIDAGVSDCNIEISGLCTRCRPDLFFSHRRQNPTGRFAAAIGLV
jgi:polyphenol oxidase